MAKKPRTKSSKDPGPILHPSVAAKAARMEANLREHYRLGQESLKSDHLSTAEFGTKNGYSGHTMRKIRAFAKRYSEEELEELCQARRPNGLPLHFGYIPFLLALDGKHKGARRKMQERAIKEGWTVPQLLREIRKAYGVNGFGGRLPPLPKDNDDELQRILDDLKMLIRRCERLTALAKTKGHKKIVEKCSRLAKTLTRAKAKVV